MSLRTLTEEHKPASVELFLDTTIHCSRFKGSLFQPRIDFTFKFFKWRGTSSYTKVEFGNVVLAQAQYYLSLLDRYNSLEAALDHIGNRLVPQYHQQKITWSFNLLRRIYGSNDLECTERARRKLRSILRAGVALVERDCYTPLENGTDCYWARKGVHKRHDGGLAWKTPKCERHLKRCRLDEFFVENRGIFEKIKEAIDALPEDSRSGQLWAFSEIIGKALREPGILLDYQTGCKRLADAIIAVDSARYKSFFTQNASESDLLTDVLGQVMYLLPQDQERGVLVRTPGLESDIPHPADEP